MEYAKIPFTAITISSSCRLDRKRIKHCANIVIIISPTIRWYQTWSDEDCIRHDDNVCPIEAKGKLYQYTEKLSLLLCRFTNTVHHQ